MLLLAVTFNTSKQTDGNICISGKIMA